MFFFFVIYLLGLSYSIVLIKRKEKYIMAAPIGTSLKTPRTEQKKLLAAEARSERLKLTSSDRHLLKAFLGYTATVDSLSSSSASPHHGQKLKPAQSACVYVKQSLFPDGLTEQEKQREATPFDIRQCIPTLIPSLFTHDEASLRDLFERGRNLNDLGQSSMIRAHQDLGSRLYTSELAIKQNGQTRIWISGSVSKQNAQILCWFLFCFVLFFFKNNRNKEKITKTHMVFFFG